MTTIRWEDEYEHHIDASLDLPQKEKDKLKAFIKKLKESDEKAKDSLEKAEKNLAGEK